MSGCKFKVGDVVIVCADPAGAHGLDRWRAYWPQPGTVHKVTKVGLYLPTGYDIGVRPIEGLDLEGWHTGGFVDAAFDIYAPTPKKKIEAFLKGQTPNVFNSNNKAPA